MNGPDRDTLPARRVSGKARVGLAVIVLGITLTLVLVMLDALRWPSGPDPTVPAPVTLQALLEEGSQQRHSLYALLREQAPGARIVIDTGGESPGIDRTYLRTLGEARQVDDIALPAGWLPTGEPDATGSLRSSGWLWYAQPGPVDTVIVGSRDGRTVLVDRRVVTGLGLNAWDRTSEPPVPPSLGRAVVVESGLLFALVLIGGLVLPRRLAPGAARPALALISGVAVQAVTGYLFLAGRPAMVVGIVVAGLIALRLRANGAEPGWRRSDLSGLVGAAVIIAVTVVIVRWAGLLIITADAVALVARSIGMAQGTLTLADLDEKRPLSGSAVQAPAHAMGIEGMHALSWVLLIAIAVVIALLPRLLSGARRAPSSSVAVAIGLAIATLVSTFMRAIGALVSTHLMVAAFLLLLTVLWALDGDRSRRSMAGPVVVLTLLALVPTRAESVLFVGLVLLATIATRLPPTGVERAWPWAWPWVWPAVGAALAGWSGLHVLAAAGQGVRPSFPVSALTIIGVLVLLAPPVLRRLPRVLGALPGVLMAGLWAAVLGLALQSERAPIFDGIRVNIGEGAGAWGTFGPIIAGAAVIATVGSVLIRERSLTLGLWITAGAFPVAVLAKAADGTNAVDFGDPSAALSSILSASARSGSWGDSTNRMWIHFAPVAIGLLVMVVAVASGGSESDGDGANRSSENTPGGPRSSLRSPVVIAVGGLALLGVLSIWRPAYLGPVAPVTVLTLEQRDLDRTGPELTGTTLFEHLLRAPEMQLPADASDPQVCVEFAFTDLDRTNWGRTEFALTGPDGAAGGDFGEMAWSGERVGTVCLPVEHLDRPVDIIASAGGGSDALTGSSAAIRVDDTGSPVGRLEVRYLALSEDPRGAVAQLVSRGVRILMRTGPAVVLVLMAGGLGLVAAGRSRVRRDDAGSIAVPSESSEEA